jgi:uncharacterized protein DUF2799
MIYKIIFIFTIFICLTGCATMNQSECNNADWQIIGMEDGAKGHLPSYLGEHRTACAEYNISPDLEAYTQGHHIGVKQYCTAKNGFNVGNKGNHYNSVCPSELEAAFLPAYQHGYDHYLLNKNIEDVESSIRYESNDIQDLKEEIVELEKLIISDGTSETQRAELLKRVKECQINIGYLEANISEFAKDKIILIDRLRQHKSHHQ